MPCVGLFLFVIQVDRALLVGHLRIWNDLWHGTWNQVWRYPP